MITERKLIEELTNIDDIEMIKQKLEEVLKQFPSDDEFITLKTWGYSANYMYTKEYKKQQGYINWCKIFHNLFDNVKYRIPKIDETKKIGLWLYFDHMDRFDVSNFQKAVQDAICNELGIDDRLVNVMACRTNKYITDVKDSRIYFVIKNI